MVTKLVLTVVKCARGPGLMEFKEVASELSNLNTSTTHTNTGNRNVAGFSWRSKHSRVERILFD